MLDAPPEIPAPGQNRAWMSTITILPMIAGAGAMALMMGGRYNTGGVNSAFGYVVGGLFGVSMLGMMVTQILTQGGQPSKKEMIEQRRDYMRRLAQTRRTIRSNIRDQRQAMFYRHPDPGALWSTVESIRLWERRSSDGDFGVVRVGLGPQEMATPLVPPDVKPVEDLEPVSAQALTGSRSSTGFTSGGTSGVAISCGPRPTRTTPKSPSEERLSHSRMLSTVDHRAPGSGCR